MPCFFLYLQICWFLILGIYGGDDQQCVSEGDSEHCKSLRSSDEDESKTEGDCAVEKDNLSETSVEGEKDPAIDEISEPPKDEDKRRLEDDSSVGDAGESMSMKKEEEPKDASSSQEGSEQESLNFENHSNQQLDIFHDNGGALGDWIGEVSPGRTLEYPTPIEGDHYYVTAKGYRKRFKTWWYEKGGNRVVITQNMIPEFSLSSCDDRDSRCPSLAGHNQEGCRRSPGWMAVNCPSTCDYCHIRDKSVRCTHEFLNISREHIYKNKNEETGDPSTMHQMFTSIVDRMSPKYEVTILSEDPWIVQFDNFFSKEDAEAILATVNNKWEQSTDTGSENEFGESKRVLSKTRTSENAWCRRGCEQSPVYKELVAKIGEVVGLPYDNFEAFQILRYYPGQFYRTHNDMAAHQNKKVAGPRILTFFLYFSDVEEGGETNFPRLDISVKPKLGRAILWPSVQVDNNLRQDRRTDHQALPVIKGTKYAANSWIHLGNQQIATLWGCTGAFD